MRGGGPAVSEQAELAEHGLGAPEQSQSADTADTGSNLSLPRWDRNLGQIPLRSGIAYMRHTSGLDPLKHRMVKRASLRAPSILVSF